MKPLRWLLLAAWCAGAVVGCGGMVGGPAGGPPAGNGATSLADSTAASSDLPDDSSRAAPREPSDDSSDEPRIPLVPLSDRTRSERRHRAAEAMWERLLRKQIDVEFVDVPLRDALEELARRAGAPPIALDAPALHDEGVEQDNTVPPETVAAQSTRSTWPWPSDRPRKSTPRSSSSCPTCNAPASGCRMTTGRPGDAWHRPPPSNGHPNSSMIGFPVVSEREMPLASCGLLIGMSRAW